MSEVEHRILRNARLVDGRHVDLEIADERIAAVAEPGTVAAEEGTAVDDLGGWLVLPAMAEPHAHLDKALTAEAVPNPRGDLMGAIEAWTSAAEAGRFTHNDMVERATAALELLLGHGVTAVRSHVNCGEEVGASSVEALVEVRDAFAGLVDLQLVALPHCPLTGAQGAGNRAGLDAAMAAGADLVGGCPHLDPDGPGLITHALAVAADAGVGVDLHVDETLNADMLTLRDLAEVVRRVDFAHPVAASHCVSLGMQPPEVQKEVARALAEAGIAVIPLPQTNLFLQGRDLPTATPRGLTALDALTEAGVLVAAGADNVQDPFNLVGRSDPLETAALLVMAGHRLPDAAYEMVSTNVRQVMGLEPVELAPGHPADLVAIDAPSVRGAIADAPMSRRTYRNGVLVASSDTTTTIHH